MKQEDKELLLKDLCARLPYKTIIQVSDWTLLDTELTVGHISRLINENLKLKPYLRSMSSMTEEEKLMYEGLMIGTDNVSYMLDVIDWLNKHHFDYRHLIEKNLAIEVTKENNPYKD